MNDFDFWGMPLADILTVTTGRRLSRDMDDVYRILHYLTGDEIMTHQIPRAIDACQLPVLQQHPQLADVTPATNAQVHEVEAWLAMQERRFGEALTLSPIEGWEHRDPIEELCGMVGPGRVIVAVAPEGAVQ
jgi:hypothetical protein